MVRDGRLLKREWLQACDAFMSVALAHTRYLRATGRFGDLESARDIAALEQEHVRLRQRLERVRAEVEAAGLVPLRLPLDPGWRLSLAAGRELRSYLDDVCEDSRRLCARSNALVRRSQEARRLRVLDRPDRRTG